MSIEATAKIHMIYSYFIESTAIRDVFHALFRSYLVSDEYLKLDKANDRDLIDLVRSIIDLAYPKPISSLTPDLNELRWNAYWRLFGYTVKGKDNFPKSAGYNPEFNKTLEDIFYNVAQGILDQGITIEKVSNPDALAMLLNDLRKQLTDRTYNQIDDLAAYWFAAFEALRELLRNNKLMDNRLGIRAIEEDRRLIQLGEKVKVQVPKETIYLYQLATLLSSFLKDHVEIVTWDAAKAEELYTIPENQIFFKEVFNAWAKVTGKDFLAEALRVRRRA